MWKAMVVLTSTLFISACQQQPQAISAPPPSPLVLAQDDRSYCKALSSMYREYARAGVIDGDAALAMSRCDSGENHDAIRVLEKTLNKAGYHLPERVLGPAAQVADTQPTVLSVRVYPLLPGLTEPLGYAVYTYLIYPAGTDPIRAAAAVCGFVSSATTVTGIPEQDNRATTALYALLQTDSPRNAELLRAADAVKRYHYQRAAAFLQRLGGYPPGIYLISYAAAPFPFAEPPDPKRLDVVEIGGLAPQRIYQYVLAYKSQLAPSASYWKRPTLRQIGIRAAESLSLIEQARGLYKSLSEAETAPSLRRLGDALKTDDPGSPAPCGG